MGLIALIISIFFVYQAYIAVNNKKTFLIIVFIVFAITCISAISPFRGVVVILFGVFSYIFIKAKEVI